MEDGQQKGVFAPDRAEDDPSGVECTDKLGPSEPVDDDDESFGESTDSDDADDNSPEVAVTREVGTGATTRGGTPDPSFEQFLAEWTDGDDDDDGLSHASDSAAASHALPPRAPLKRTKTTSSSTGAGPSKMAKTTVASRSTRPQVAPTRVSGGRAPPSTPQVGATLTDSPLNIPPLRFRMPMGAPRTVGYAS